MRIILNMLVFILLAPAAGNAQDTLMTGTDEQQEDNAVKHGLRFIDEDGDGFNDNAPDHDGDGIPNGLDPDYQGPKNRHRHGFRDLDGDGIDDNLMAPAQTREKQQIGPAGPGERNQTPGEEGTGEKHQRRRGSNQQ